MDEYQIALLSCADKFDRCFRKNKLLIPQFQTNEVIEMSEVNKVQCTIYFEKCIQNINKKTEKYYNLPFWEK